MYNYNINFEYDPQKSESNRQKHGISFEEAQALWETVGVEREVPNPYEKRWIRIAILKNKMHTCVFTIRGEKIRIISVRRSRLEEEKLFQWRVRNEKEDKQN